MCLPHVEFYGCLCAVETFPSCNVVDLQDVMQCEHADIQQRQELQLMVTMQGQEVIQQGLEDIKRGQQQNLLVTEDVLAEVQGLKEDISHQSELRGN